jgi:hypothetical protein
MHWISKLFGRGNRNIDTSLKYVDGDDSRTWQILADMDRMEALKSYPDFDIAYLRAAYPTDRAEDHQNANIELLEEGLEKSIVKSRILARLSNYYVSKHTPGADETACDYAIQSLLALKKHPDETYLQPIILLQQLFAVHGYRKEVEKLEAIRPRYTLGSQEQKDLSEVKQIMAHNRQMAEDARHRLRSLRK